MMMMMMMIIIIIFCSLLFIFFRLVLYYCHSYSLASTGALYNVFSGWRKMVVGVVIGGGLR